MNRGRRSEQIFSGSHDFKSFIAPLKEGAAPWGVNVSGPKAKWVIRYFDDGLRSTNTKREGKEDLQARGEIDPAPISSSEFNEPPIAPHCANVQVEQKAGSSYVWNVVE